MGDGPTKFMAQVVGKKFLNAHHRGIVFAREPTLSLVWVCASDAAGVASRSVAASAVIDKEAISVEGLRKRNVNELAIGGH